MLLKPLGHLSKFAPYSSTLLFWEPGARFELACPLGTGLQIRCNQPLCDPGKFWQTFRLGPVPVPAVLLRIRPGCLAIFLTDYLVVAVVSTVWIESPFTQVLSAQMLSHTVESEALVSVLLLVQAAKDKVATATKVKINFFMLITFNYFLNNNPIVIIAEKEGIEPSTCRLVSGVILPLNYLPVFVQEAGLAPARFSCLSINL